MLENADRHGALVVRMEATGMELRQLRYFVTLAEELHFGRAAAREHIVQSGLSQQVQRLERELGVRLLERSTHHVALTVAGSVFLVEARQILAQVERAAEVARSAVESSPRLRVGIIDAGCESMPQILQALHDPDLAADVWGECQVEQPAGQFRRARGRRRAA
jgi:DNA-binding transcriptional LysR family regulator